MAGSMSNEALRPETIAAHALRAVDEATGAVVPPIYLSSTYARDEDYKPLLKENYVRNGNPTLWQTEEAIAALEGGTSALLFASGMAAITTLRDPRRGRACRGARRASRAANGRPGRARASAGSPRFPRVQARRRTILLA